MANLPIRDGQGNEVYIKAAGAGSDVDPFILERSGTVTVGAALPAGSNLIGKVTSQSTNGTVTATIALSGNLSSGVDLGAGNALSKIHMSAGWDTAAITLQVSLDNSNWANLYDDLGNEVTIQAAASRAIALTNIAQLAGYRYIKVRSGTSGTPVTQTAQRDLTVVTLPF